jgi:hypothetical protein
LKSPNDAKAGLKRITSPGSACSIAFMIDSDKFGT